MPASIVHASVVQINVSKGGVPKRPIPEGTVTRLGIDGDLHAHPQIHGGPQKALLLITSEGIEELRRLGYPLDFGSLGENLTTRGLDRRQLRVGQRYRTPEVVIELTRVRTPCETLSVYGPGIQKAVYDGVVKAGDPSSPLWGMSGFYAAVVTPGTIRTGDPLVLVDQAV